MDVRFIVNLKVITGQTQTTQGSAVVTDDIDSCQK